MGDKPSSGRDEPSEGEASDGVRLDVQALLSIMGESAGRGYGPVDDGAFPDQALLLAAVIDQYLGSREFNGLPMGQSTGPHRNCESLIRAGLVQFVTSTDYMNTHIRPWAKGDVDRQVAEIGDVAAGRKAGCLYPTKKAMAAHGPDLTHSEPYRDRMTLGGGTLELVFFDLAAVDGYVQDPNFEFIPEDDGFKFSTAPSAYEGTDPSEILSFSAAYAYDHQVDYRGDEPIRRYWCAFLCDLVDLPARHQTRLSTYEKDETGLLPHPEWWSRSIGANWTETIGPFDKILAEMNAINEIWVIAFGQPLFANTERPRNWSWLLRPTSGAWEQFVLVTDKLLSDNLRPKGLDAAEAPKKNDAGQSLGTLGRLQALFVARSSTPNAENVRFVLQPLADVRKARQSPAHRLADTVTDANVVNRQRDLVRDVADALHGIRVFVQSHPAVVRAGWSPPPYIDMWRWL